MDVLFREKTEICYLLPDLSETCNLLVFLVAEYEYAINFNFLIT